MSMSKGPNAEKGARYLGQLDQALCNGQWSEIQELARKTDKHAPARRCLTLAARSEAQIASAAHRPTSASSSVSSSIHGLGELVPKLVEAIAAEEKYAEDAYAARVCLAEVHWLQEDLEGAVESLQQNDVTARADGGHATVLGWMEVCDVKSMLIKVIALQHAGKDDEAQQQYLAAALKAPGTRTPELRRWTERLLARACMFTRQRATVLPTIQTLSESLRCFLAWETFWQRASGSSANSATSHLDISRRQVWKAYYDLLSTVLRHGLMYNPWSSSPSDLLTLPVEDISNGQYTSAKSKQQTALQRVGSTYESLLLNETRFPKAIETNAEVEEWTEQVFNNWKIFCSSEWTDAGLRDGGRESMGRGVLDILYRAATKTFHSTSILRQLFNVHAALGDFDLALHAFDSYVELVNKAKARAEKSGKHELGFDSEDTVMLTAAEAVRILCRYGDREQAEKAIEVSETIRVWLGQDKPNSSENANTSSDDNRVEESRPCAPPTESKLQRWTLAAAYQSIGISKAHWARLTYESDSRSTLQSEALDNLRNAQAFDTNNIQTAFALALLLAETRQVATATEVTKHVLASSSLEDAQEDDDITDYTRERQLVPIWHLLALCLTARDDYEQAAKMCEIAFEQFGDATVLFGDDTNRVSDESEKPVGRSFQGVVHQMEGLEKEGLIQVKMSQISLLELMEGVEAAVEVGRELLALYSRLFGNPELAQPLSRAPQTAASVATSKLGGTLRSFAGSIRPKSARNSHEREVYTQNSSTIYPPPKGNTTAKHDYAQENGAPIAITVTNEDGMATEKPHHHHFPFKVRGQHGDWRDHGNLKPVESSESMRGKPIPSRTKQDPGVPEKVGTPILSQSAASPEQPLKEMARNAPLGAWPPPAGHTSQPPRQDVRLPAPSPASTATPEPRLSNAKDRQHKISLLTSVWLFIAGLYLRADLLDEATGAVDEAHKLADSFEMEVGSEHSSARRFFERGWAGGKSVDELWADVWAAKGDLAIARSQPFAALSAYEQSLAHWPDHLEGTIGLSNLLMDIYEEKIPAEEPQPLLQSTSTSNPNSSIPSAPRLARLSPNPSTPQPTGPAGRRGPTQDPPPAMLNRLASRDRAYMLLSNLTRLGSGWDNSEAWLTLARAHELSKQVGKAKEALWWVVEVEENKPMRPWSDVSAGGFTL